jgi:biotin carboxyl carrier protein
MRIFNRAGVEPQGSDLSDAVPSLGQAASAVAAVQPTKPLASDRRALLLGVLALMLLLSGLVFWARRPSAALGAGTPSASGGQRTATVARADFVRSVRIHGTVEAINSHAVAAPRLVGQNLNTLVITKLMPAGTAVKKGDLLVEFDRQNQIKAALDRRAEYRDFLEQIKKKQAEQAAAASRDDTELRLAESQLGVAELDMRKNEILPRIDAEKNQLNLEEARARLQQLRETYALKRRAAQAEIHVLEIQRDRALNAATHAEQNSEKMAIRSTIDGVVVFNPIWKGGQMGEVQEGDEVRTGVPFLQVINPAAMQVRARVNQADISPLRTGQRVSVRLDAYPDLQFSGTVEQIAAIGVVSGLSDKVRGFVVRFAIQGSEPRLTPDLSAAVDVEIDRRAGVLLVPRDAVFEENGQSYVQVMNAGDFEKRAVKTGPLNDTEIVIESGVEPGAIVQRGMRKEGRAAVRAQTASSAAKN